MQVQLPRFTFMALYSKRLCPCIGQPSTITIVDTNAAIIAMLFQEDKRITVQEIKAETGISKTSANRILTQVLGK